MDREGAPTGAVAARDAQPGGGVARARFRLGLHAARSLPCDDGERGSADADVILPGIRCRAGCGAGEEREEQENASGHEATPVEVAG